MPPWPTQMMGLGLQLGQLLDLGKDLSQGKHVGLSLMRVPFSGWFKQKSKREPAIFGNTRMYCLHLKSGWIFWVLVQGSRETQLYIRAILHAPVLHPTSPTATPKVWLMQGRSIRTGVWVLFPQIASRAKNMCNLGPSAVYLNLELAKGLAPICQRFLSTGWLLGYLDLCHPELRYKKMAKPNNH